MPDKKAATTGPKHYTGFWPLFIVFIIALILGGIITMFAYNNGLQDEIDSISIKIHKPDTAPLKKLPAKR